MDSPAASIHRRRGLREAVTDRVVSKTADARALTRLGPAPELISEDGRDDHEYCGELEPRLGQCARWRATRLFAPGTRLGPRIRAPHTFLGLT